MYCGCFYSSHYWCPNVCQTYVGPTLCPTPYPSYCQWSCAVPCQYSFNYQCMPVQCYGFYVPMCFGAFPAFCGIRCKPTMRRVVHRTRRRVVYARARIVEVDSDEVDGDEVNYTAPASAMTFNTSLCVCTC